MPVLQQLRIGIRDKRAWYGESQPLIATRSGQNERVDSDECTVRVHQRASAVAGINRSVGLNVDKRTVRVRLPGNRADYAHRNRVAQALGASEGEDHFA